MPSISVAPVQIATNDETAAGANAKKAISPAALFSGLTRLIGSNGYQKLPNGTIIQWMQQSVGASANTAFAWPTAFPNATLAAWAIRLESGADGNKNVNPSAWNNSTVTIQSNYGSATLPVVIIGIGY